MLHQLKLEKRMNYLINSNMKALRCGDFVKADLSIKEFIYNTAAPDTAEHTTAVMRGNADANSIVIPDNLTKRGEIAQRLATELTKLKLPEVKKMTETESATKIIVAGVEADKSDDMILVDIVNSGISFRNAGKLFKKIMEEKGLRISNKTRQEQVFALLKKNRFKKPAEWQKVQDMLDLICGEEGVNDTTEKQALLLVRRYAKEAEFVLPKAPKKAAGSKGKAKITDWMVANPKATQEEFTKFMLELGKKENVAKRFFEWFAVAQRMAETITNPPEEAAAE